MKEKLEKGKMENEVEKIKISLKNWNYFCDYHKSNMQHNDIIIKKHSFHKTKTFPEWFILAVSIPK